MKNIVLTLLALLCLITSSFAQNKINKYCEIKTFQRGVGNKIGVMISIGEIDSLFSFKDSTVKTSLQKVETLKTVSDVLNYMASLGWTLISSTAIHLSGTKNFYFKKEFDYSDLPIIKK